MILFRIPNIIYIITAERNIGEYEVYHYDRGRQKWGLSSRRIGVLCSEGRIAGVQKVANTWLIPEDAERPTDARIRSGKYIKANHTEGK